MTSLSVSAEGGTPDKTTTEGHTAGGRFITVRLGSRLRLATLSTASPTIGAGAGVLVIGKGTG